MALTTYDYDLDVVFQAQLGQEILASAITNVATELDLIENTGEASPGLNIHITFLNALSAPDLAILDAIIAAHPAATPPEDGDTVYLEDVNGNPGLPAVDGSQLTGISVAQIGGLSYSVDLIPEDSNSWSKLGDAVIGTIWSNSGTTKKVIGQAQLLSVVNLGENPKLVVDLYTAYTSGSPVAGNAKIDAVIRYIADSEGADKTADESLTVTAAMTGTNLQRTRAIFTLDKAKLAASDTISIMLDRDHADAADTYGGKILISRRATVEVG